jgi:putative colanic acid biosynthesis UDP-glucose lipid carrier transferase
MAITTRDLQPQLHANLPVATLVRMLLDPALAIASLYASAQFFAVRFEGPYIILALLVFSLTFPSESPRGTSAGALARQVLGNWIFIVGLLLLLGWATRTLDSVDARVVAAWAAFAPVAIFTGQLLFPVLVPKLLATEGLHRVAVVVGAGEVGSQLARRIRETPFLGVQIAGFFDDRAPHRVAPHPGGELLGNLGGLAEYVKRNRVDLIYLALPIASQPRILKLLDDLHDTTASIYFAPDIFLFDLINARMDSIGGIPVVAVCETPYFGIDGVLKRASDIVIATTVLLVGAPVMLAIAAAVKLTSPGPVLFKQRRYGLDGREIVVYKYRTMTVCEDGNDIRQASRNDSRVTPLGAFLRRTSLDELPQFINVLQGRMSVVGPRPHAVAHNEMYRKLIKSYMVRHKVRPGITGWAQVHGLRGETETVDKMRARIEYDLDYLRHWSLQLDLAILWRTLFVVFKRENAY